MPKAVLATCCLALLLGASRPAHADPVYIRGGYYVIGSTGDSYRFPVTNPDVPGWGVDVDGSAASVAGISAMTCLVCEPGQTYEIGRRTQGPGWLGRADMGTARVTFYSPTSENTSNYAVAGWLTFLADPIALPAWGSSSVSFAVPFRARVSLDGSSLDHPGAGFFSRWIGMGTAHVTFTPTSDGRWANNSGEMLRFDFSAQPVPEPATMFLIATGLAGVAARRFRKVRP